MVSENTASTICFCIFWGFHPLFSIQICRVFLVFFLLRVSNVTELEWLPTATSLVLLDKYCL